MDKKTEIEKKIKKILVILKSIDEKKKEITDPQEVEKLVRMKSYLVQELKGQKEELVKLDKLNQLSVTIKDDETQGAKAFKKNSLKEGKVKKIRYSLIVYLFLYTLVNIGLIFQRFFYNSAEIKKQSAEQFKSAVENFYFIWKFFIIITLIYFTIYIINAKYFKNKMIVVYLVYTSLILGYFTYMRIDGGAKIIEKITLGQGFGFIPGVIGVVATYFLVKNITYIKKRKIIKIKKKEE